MFYRVGVRTMRGAVSTEPEVRAGRPEVLSEGSFGVGTNHYVTADGKRFVMTLDDPVVRRRIHVLLSWTEELSRLVPNEN